MKRYGATRKETRKRRLKPSAALVRGLVSFVVLAVLLYGGMWVRNWAHDPLNLPIRTVRIQGEFRYLESGDLERVVADVATGGFFTVDVEAVRDTAASLPWVDAVNVRRVWPDTLRVQVTEQRPVARWAAGGMVNGRGELFHPASDKVGLALPVLEGPDAQRKLILEQYGVMNRLVEAAGFRIERLVRDARGAWRMVWDNGVEIKMGRSESLARLARFLGVFDRVQASGQVLVSADLRYSNGFALRWETDTRDG